MPRRKRRGGIAATLILSQALSGGGLETVGYLSQALALPPSGAARLRFATARRTHSPNKLGETSFHPVVLGLGTPFFDAAYVPALRLGDGRCGTQLGNFVRRLAQIMFYALDDAVEREGHLEFQRCVFELWKHMAGEQVALRRVGIAGEDEGFDAQGAIGI